MHLGALASLFARRADHQGPEAVRARLLAQLYGTQVAHHLPLSRSPQTSA